MATNSQLTIDGQPINIRAALPGEVIDLRHRVLRATLPRAEAIFPGDDLPTSSHFVAATSNGSIIGCATFHLSQWQGDPAFQLRGMATDPAWAGKGIGTAVLGFAIDSINATSSLRLFWCNGRLIAVPFYENLGWKIASERFDIPTAGPHYRMVRDMRQ